MPSIVQVQLVGFSICAAGFTVYIVLFAFRSWVPRRSGSISANGDISGVAITGQVSGDVKQHITKNGSPRKEKSRRDWYDKVMVAATVVAALGGLIGAVATLLGD